MLCKWGHERHRPYVNLIRDWVNSADPDGEWEVTKLLAVRGPPERRFWLIECGHQLTDAVAGTTDTGGFDSDWQPAANVIRCHALQRTFWHDNLHLNPLADCEGKNPDGTVQWQCFFCNQMGFKRQASFTRHCNNCKFKPVVRQRSSPAGRLVVDNRRQAAQAEFPLCR